MKMRLLIVCASALLMMSCENPMTLRTKVNEDGSIDKSITFEKAEERLVANNIFGISEKNAWAVTKEVIEKPTEKGKSEKYKIAFKKHFSSSEEMNRELDNATDSLFHVHSQFDKKFRWFYTYIRYSETIRPINRFKMVSAQDFFNQEDSLFIQRLPAEGKPISKADSLYLQVLNEKINNRFVTLALFKETFSILEAIVQKNAVDKEWREKMGSKNQNVSLKDVITLSKNRELVYKLIEKDQGEFKDIAAKVFDTLSIPIPKQQAIADFKALSKDLTSRTDFMSFARDGKYLNVFEMPWEIVSSNADSVAGKNLYWKPIVNKFAYMPYEMYAECRRMNWWAMTVSVVIVGVTLFLLRRKPK